MEKCREISTSLHAEAASVAPKYHRNGDVIRDRKEEGKKNQTISVRELIASMPYYLVIPLAVSNK